MIKELTINGMLFAKYEIDIDKGIIFIKTAINIYEGDEYTSVNVLVAIINKIEGTKIKTVGYLNI